MVSGAFCINHVTHVVMSLLPLKPERFKRPISVTGIDQMCQKGFVGSSVRD